MSSLNKQKRLSKSLGRGVIKTKLSHLCIQMCPKMNVQKSAQSPLQSRANFVVVIVGLQPFGSADHCRAMGCWKEGNIGPWRNGRRPSKTCLALRGSLPVGEASETHPSSQQPPPTPGAARSPPHARWTTYTRLSLATLGVGDEG